MITAACHAAVLMINEKVDIENFFYSFLLIYVIKTLAPQGEIVMALAPLRIELYNVQYRRWYSMSKERCSLHKGKGAGSAKHNQHLHVKNENRDVAVFAFDHLDDDELQEYNITKDPNNKDGIYAVPFSEDMLNDNIDYLTPFELNFYENQYHRSLDIQNAKHKADRHPGRVKTMQQFYSTKRYAPVEEMLQWGNISTDNLPDKDTYNEIVETYVFWLKEWSDDNGGHLHILDWSNHFDEATPHTQLRYIWDWTDENGVTWCEQEKAMEMAGLKLPHPEEPNGRCNNRNMTFTAMCRTKWQDIVESFGFEVERETLPPKPHVSTYAYIRRQMQEQKAREEALNEREKNINLKQQELDDREGYVEFKEAELVTAENSLEERIKEQDLQKQQFESYKKIEEQRLDAMKKKGQKVVHTAEQKGSRIQNNNNLGFDPNLYQ